MRNRTAEKLAKLFCAAFTLCFLWLINHILTGSFYGCHEAALLGCALCALALLLFLQGRIMAHEALLESHHRAITAGVLGLLFALQLTFGALLRYRPVFDVDAIYGGAIEWVETGTIASYREYFSYFYNNFGGLCFFRGVFLLARGLGWTDWYMAAVTANALLSTAAVYLTADAARQLLGPAGRFLALALFLLSPPFYFIAPAFYTDALAMPFPILACWLYLKLKTAERRRDCALLLLALGLTAAVGIPIKPVTAIVFLAIAIDAALTAGWRRAAMTLIVPLLCFALSAACVNSAVAPHLDREEAARNRTPLLHWVMMGLEGNGMYNPGDYEFTRSFDDRGEQTAALLDEIGARVRARGFWGMTELFTRKAEICFGDGTLGLEDCLGGTPLRETRLRELLLSGGRYYDVYKHLCTGVLLAVYALMIFAGARDLFHPDGPAFRVPAPRLAVFGLLLFLLCWEARWRYFSSFVPLIYLSALPGAEPLLARVRAAARGLGRSCAEKGGPAPDSLPVPAREGGAAHGRE